MLIYGLLQLLEVRICKHDDAEPPLVRARVPVVGHLLGLLRHGVFYYRMLRLVRIVRCSVQRSGDEKIRETERS